MKSPNGSIPRRSNLSTKVRTNHAANVRALLARGADAAAAAADGATPLMLADGATTPEIRELLAP